MDGFDPAFFAEVLVGGLLSGVMYSLVAIGFVLIYKTSGVLDFAPVAQLLVPALTFVSMIERGMPFAEALALTFAAMVLGGDAATLGSGPTCRRCPSGRRWRSKPDAPDPEI